MNGNKKYEYEYHYDDDRMCIYCGDEPSSLNGYCSGYCMYRDIEVVPRKQQMILNYKKYCQSVTSKVANDFIQKIIKEACDNHIKKIQ